MPEPEVKVPAEESKDTKPAEEVAAPKKEETIGDALNTKIPTKEPKMVPEAVLIEYKKENKEIHKELRDLKALIESGATKKEVSGDLKALAEKHNVDPEFLSEFADSVRKEADSKIDEKINEKIKPIEEKENAEKREKVFNQHFDKTLEEMPEYKDLVNKDVIRALVMDPKNANKTFAQIFNDSYGHLVTGKKTLDTTTPRGGQEDASIDFARAKSDSKYFEEIMADPQLKAKYNADLATRLRL